MAKTVGGSRRSSNVATLEKAGLIDDTVKLTKKEVELVEAFSKDEIRLMISIAKKASPKDPRLKRPSPKGLICMPL